MLSPPDAAPYRIRSTCRICESRDLVPILDLGDMPLANALREPADTGPELRIPLCVMLCQECSLSQLSAVVSPERMFSRYVYRSGIAETFRRHCSWFAREAKKIARPGRGALVVDIGGNDGTLLHAFRAEGFRPLAVEPAANIAEIARAGGIDTMNAFWSRATAKALVEQWGRPALITATNVFAHVDDLDDFLSGVTDALDEKGCFVLEVPYMADLIEKNEFDTIYHEHLSYFLLRPLLRLADRHELEAKYVRRIPVHGGGLRVYLKRKSGRTFHAETAQAMLSFEEEAGLYTHSPYRNFARQIDSIRRDLRETMMRLIGDGRTVAAYGASAKGATLLNSAGIDRGMIRYIVDDTPEKQGRLAPGTGIPIVGAKELETARPDYLLILAWNFVDEILAKTSAFSQAGGRYIVPVPALRYIE
ncbi:MAG: class I SAM-dependent methyltransferase [Candidatus Hydrogenedentota bacterium]